MDEVGQGGDLTILKIKCPTPGAWFHRQIPTSTIGMNIGDLTCIAQLHFYAQSQMPHPSGLFLRSNAVKSPISPHLCPSRGYIVGLNIDRCIIKPPVKGLA